MDECQPFKNRCHPTNGECVNTEGSYVCRCRPGFQGDGIDCKCKFGISINTTNDLFSISKLLIVFDPSSWPQAQRELRLPPPRISGDGIDCNRTSWTMVTHFHSLNVKVQPILSSPLSSKYHFKLKLLQKPIHLYNT